MGKVRGRSGEGLSGLVGNVVFYNFNNAAFHSPGTSLWVARAINRFKSLYSPKKLTLQLRDNMLTFAN